MKEIKGVKIGDKFRIGKHGISEVIDFYEIRSVTTGESKCFQCIAKGINTFATNCFEVPFSTVLRNKI